jgi:hypothetical protein
LFVHSPVQHSVPVLHTWPTSKQVHCPDWQLSPAQQSPVAPHSPLRCTHAAQLPLRQSSPEQQSAGTVHGLPSPLQEGMQWPPLQIKPEQHESPRHGSPDTLHEVEHWPVRQARFGQQSFVFVHGSSARWHLGSLQVPEWQPPVQQSSSAEQPAPSGRHPGTHASLTHT